MENARDIDIDEWSRVQTHIQTDIEKHIQLDISLKLKLFHQKRVFVVPFLYKCVL